MNEAKTIPAALPVHEPQAALGGSGTRILVVEDSRTQAEIVRLMLEGEGYEVAVALDGLQALEAIRSHPPDIVLTDLHMPRLDGMQLVSTVRKEQPQILIVMITADGSEELAVQALASGATSYIPKRVLDRDLLPGLHELVLMLQARDSHARVRDALVASESTFIFGNDLDFITPLIAHVDDDLRNCHYDDPSNLFRVLLSIREAVVNAIEHGNLELDSHLRDQYDGSYQRLGNQRRHQEPYCSRRVTLQVCISPHQLLFVVRDEGPGFDLALIPNPRDAYNLVKPYGRGLMLIQNFMDEVRHNRAGNEITMTKYRVTRPDSPG